MSGDTANGDSVARLRELRSLTTDDLEAIIRAPERLRALALDLEARALRAVEDGQFEAATQTIQLATAYVQLAEAWEPNEEQR